MAVLKLLCTTLSLSQPLTLLALVIFFTPEKEVKGENPRAQTSIAHKTSTLTRMAPCFGTCAH